MWQEGCDAVCGATAGLKQHSGCGGHTPEAYGLPRYRSMVGGSGPQLAINKVREGGNAFSDQSCKAS